MLNVTATLISRYNYKVKVETTSDSLIHRVDFYVLICEEAGLITQGYYYQGGQAIFFSN